MLSKLPLLFFLSCLVFSPLLKSQDLSNLSVSFGISHWSSDEEIGHEKIYPKIGYRFLVEYSFLRNKKIFPSVGLGYYTSGIGGAATFYSIEGDEIYVKSSTVWGRYVYIPASVNISPKLSSFAPNLKLSMVFSYLIEAVEGEADLLGFTLPTSIGHLYNQKMIGAIIEIGFPVNIKNVIIVEPFALTGKDLTPSITDDQSTTKYVTEIYLSTLGGGIRFFLN